MKLRKKIILTLMTILTILSLVFIILTPLSEKNYKEALLECKNSNGDDESVETIMYNHGFFFGGVLDSKPNLIELELAFINKHLYK
jgi:uncharacterized alpha/beta hydrolase family protein